MAIRRARGPCATKLVTPPCWMHARREEMEQPYLRLRQIVFVAPARDDPPTDVGASESITFTGADHGRTGFIPRSG